MWKSRFGMLWGDRDSYNADVAEVMPTNDGGIIGLTVNPTMEFGIDLPDGRHDGSEYADIYLCKFSSSGTLEWEKYIGGTRWDYAFNLSLDRFGNILIAGQTWSATNYFASKRRSVDTASMAYKTNGGVSDSIYRDTAISNEWYRQYMRMNDAFVAKFSPAGQLMNIKCFGGSSTDKFIHIKDHPVYGYVAVGYSDSKDLDLPAAGTKGVPWILHLDTALNIVQNIIVDSALIGTSSFFIKDDKMYLSDSLRFRQIGYNGSIEREHNANGAKFNASSYFDSSGYIYKPIDNQKLMIYDSTLQFVDSLKFPGWEHGYYSMVGMNRNNLYLIGNNTNFEFRSWPLGSPDPDWDVYSNAVINFADQFNFFKGKTYVDNNKNNLFDAGESFLNGVKVEAQKQNNVFTVTTDTEGRFSLPLDTGSYRIKVSSPLPYYSIFPSTANVQFTSFGVNDSIDFALQPIPNKKDLSINLLPLNIARPGFPVQYQLICTNQGTETISNVQVKFLRNPRVSFVSASPVVNATIGDTLIWNIASLKPFDTSYINLDLRIAAPPTVNNTDTLLFKSFVFPLIADETPEDNQFNLVQQVQGSYDPNDKTETHGGIITPEQLAGDEFLTYLIRFQNTGTDTAFTVMIRDTLTNKLDWNSFEMLSSSHPYQLYMIKPHILEFSFPNILLVDSSKNEPASHGFVAYRIKPKSNLAVGDTVLNRAHIYFDYNLPVITNDELTVLRNTVITSVIDIDRPHNQLLLYPNPSNGLVTIFRKGQINGNANLQIIDMNGKVVHQSNLGRISTEQFNQSVDVSGLVKGMYVVRLLAGRDIYQCKFIIQ
ncbi:DUF7619 domain-containing protein [Lacibacter sp. H407]|uniref:DUF7619 domain-containing protein n=1 Tax=Lacibacter sp. H407 TaxID=3133423 RepID=UPI0030C2A593